MDWMLLPFRRYAEFTGRSRRKEYWMFVLFNVIVIGILAVIVFGVAGAGRAIEMDAAAGDDLSVYRGLFGGAGLLIVIYWLAVLIPSIAVGVRRLHDRNMSGWWYLGFIVLGMIPVVGFIASIAFLVVMALPGTEGPNQYGPDPKSQGNAQVFD